MKTSGPIRLIHGALYLLVASIPFEYPGRTIPLEVPTLTAAIFLLATLAHPRHCYGRLPAATLSFLTYLLVFVVSLTLGSGDYLPDAIKLFFIYAQCVLVLWAAANVLRDQAVAKSAILTLVVACAVRAALPFVGFGKTTSAVWTGGERVSALGQNANNAAMILAAGLVALVGLAYGWQLLNRRIRLLAGGIGALIGLALLETGSRGGLASLVGAVLVFALAASSPRHRIRNSFLAVIAIGSLAAAAWNLPMMRNRLEESYRTGAMAGREQIYPALWAMFLEKPVLGWGPSTNEFELPLRMGDRSRPRRGAHNFILQLLSSTGLAGTIPFLLGMWFCARSAWRARAGPHGVLPLALLCAVLIANLSGDWSASKLLWLVLAYAIASDTWGPATVRSGRPVWLSPEHPASIARRSVGAARGAGA